ncbi:hypothetical protein CLU79DRAFT_702454, partial [Phycomyces nitens]
LSPAQWTVFWSLPLSHISCNIWYRFLHHSIFSASLLHHIMPTIVSSSACRLGSHPNQTPEHLLISCPKMWKVWADILSHWIPSFSPSPDSVLSALSKVKLPPNGPFLPSSQVFGAVLQVGWRAYWAFIFDAIPFISVNVTTSTHKLLHTCIDQANIP